MPTLLTLCITGKLDSTGRYRGPSNERLGMLLMPHLMTDLHLAKRLYLKFHE